MLPLWYYVVFLETWQY